MSLYILTKPEAKDLLGITDVQDDAAIERWMEGLQARFDQHLERTLLRGTHTELVDGGGRFLLLRSWPIESVTSVHWSPEHTWDATTLIDPANYVLHADRGRLSWVGDLPWYVGLRVFRVVYIGGYVAAGVTPSDGQTAMPEDIRRAFALQLNYEWRNRNEMGRQQQSAQGVTIQAGNPTAVLLRGTTLLPEVEATLQPYRRIA